MTESLRGRRVVVVGASSGTGRAIALEAARQGAEIAVVARREGALADLLQEAGRGVAIVADLADGDGCVRMGQQAGEALGEVDVVVVTAARGHLRVLREMSAEDWDVILGTNVVGTNQAIAALLPHLAKGAVVVVLSSEAAGSPYWGLGAYAASKSALEDCMRAWRTECPAVRFLTVSIAATMPTEFSSGWSDEEMAEAFAKWQSQGKVRGGAMEAHEVADVFVSNIASLLRSATVGMETLTLRTPAPILGMGE